MVPPIFIAFGAIFNLIACTASQPTLHSLTSKRDDAVSILQANDTTALNVELSLCADLSNPTFLPPQKFKVSDCYRAFLQFDAQKEYDKYQVLEFLNTTTQAISRGSPQVRLPLKWVHKTCTLAIAMHGDFAPGILPFESRSRYAPSDVTTFSRVAAAAKNIEVECVRLAQPGWHTAGDLKAVVVAYWPTGSRIDKDHPASSARLSEVSVAGSQVPTS